MMDITILSQIVIYIVIGYVFLRTYKFVALKQRSDNIDHILTSSLVVGFIYYEIANMIPISISVEIDNILIVLSALCLGYLLASILNQKKFVRFVLDKLKIQNTDNIYIWDDIMDDKYPMKMCIKYEDAAYSGMVHFIESYTSNPRIALGAYVVENSQGKITEDYSNDSTKIIVLNIAAAKFAQVEYYHNSAECTDIKDLCNSNNIFNNQ